jgi:ubiquinone/menaquinone biosynthesis C-methylase UbiE
MSSRYAFECWLSPAELASLPSSKYWNDEEAERSKVWDVTGGDFAAVEAHAATLGLMAQLTAIKGALAGRGHRIGGRGASLACGTAWLEAQMLAGDAAIEHVSCVEFSRHRIERLAPLMLDHYGIAPERVRLCLGSFYDLKFEDGEFDFVVLSQAFHHADDPLRLLAEVRRILKPGGVVVVIGEHWFGSVDYARRLAKHFAKWVLNRKGWRTRTPLLPRYRHLYPPDVRKGDTFYSPAEYDRMFASFGFGAVHHVRRPIRQQAFGLLAPP